MSMDVSWPRPEPLSLVDFLLARIGEDEAEARSASTDMWGGRIGSSDGFAWGSLVLSSERDMTPVQDDFIARWEPARVLAECEAKRRIIEMAEDASGLDMSLDGDRAVGPRDETVDPYIGDEIHRALAAVYAHHPDYRQEWRP